MALKVLSERGLSNAATARTLDVTEGAVRYHLKRQTHLEQFDLTLFEGPL